MAGGNVNVVEIIKRLLFDGRTTDINLILKELLQNADDAHADKAVADHLAFGFHPGLEGAAHPLLKDPALFAVNNGPFLLKNADGIMGLAESPKIDDPSAIGKFGIGLKSVFYFGEVFFFLCRSEDDLGRLVEPLSDVFNPYNEPRKNIRPTWDGFGPADRTLMREALDALGVLDGFVIWVPLRTRQAVQLDGKSISIDAIMPGDEPEAFAETIRAPDVVDRLRRAMPLLRHIRTIDIHSLAGTVNLVAEVSGQSQYPNVTGQHSFGGQITQPAVPAFVFEATEVQPRDAVFDEIQADGYWARSMRADQSEQVADKTRAHASVTFARQASGTGRLRLQWAVFLPLGEALDYPCEGTTEFSLTLHGSFFVNSDRRTILDWSKPPISVSSSGDLQTRWNAKVAQCGTFPLLLPTLARFAQGLNIAEVDHLTAAVVALPVVKEYRAVVCETDQWVKVVTTVGPQWQLLPAAQAVHELPFSHDLTRWLPGVGVLARDGYLAIWGAPHLLSARSAAWTPDHVLLLLSGLRLEMLAGHHLRELVGILQVVANLETRPVILETLRRLMLVPRQALEGSELRETLVQVAGFLKVTERFVVPPGQSAELRQQLAALLLDVVLVPGELLPKDAESGTLTVRDAVTVLSALQGTTGKDNVRSRVMGAVSPEDQDVLRKEIREMNVVEVYGVKRDRRLVTPTQATELAEGGHLYQYAETSSAASAVSWSKLLQAAFPGHALATTSGSVMRVLGKAILLPLGEEAALALLGRGISLGKESARRDLLEALTPGLLKRTAEVDRRAYRLLVHGHPGADLQPVYTLGEASQAVQALAVQVFSARGEAWRIVPQSLAAQLNDLQRVHLQVQLLSLEGIRKEIEAYDGSSGRALIDPGKFSEQHRHDLILELPADLLGQLPLLETVEGTFTTLDRACFLPGTSIFPPTVTASVRFLRQTLALADRYGELKIGPLTAEALIEYLLRGEAPEKYAVWILTQLAEVTLPVRQSLLSLLRRTPWLTMATGKGVAPDQVIDLPPIEREVKAALDRLKAEAVTPGHLDATLGEAAVQTLQRRTLFPDATSAADRLGALLRKDPGHVFAVGDATPSSPLTYAQWSEVFSDVPHESLRSWPLLKALEKWENHPGQADRLFATMRIAFAAPHLPAILNGLGHKRRGSLKLRDELHRAYLAELVAQGRWEEDGPALQLPSAVESWKPAPELCFEAPGIMLDDQLAPAWRPVLQSVCEPAGVPVDDTTLPDEERATETGVRDLLAMFERWGDQVEGVLIGAFLSVLGGHDAMRASAADFLGLGEDADLIRQRLVGDWRDPRAAHRFFAQLVQRVWVVPNVTREREVTVTSLTGQPLPLKLSAEPELLAGPPEIQLLSGARFDFKVNLKINEFDPRGLGGDQLSRALLEATRAILKSVYRCVPENLDEAWKELDDTAQFALELAQDLIVDDSLSYVIHQLRIPREHPLKTMFEEWRELRATIKRHAMAGQSTDGSQRRVLVIRQEFRALLDDADPGTAAGLLEGVRRRVKEARYAPSSVPFEIFQNADDAALQLEVMRAEQDFQVRHEEDLFVVEQDADGVTFMHWGRAINQYALGRFHDSHYQLDLNNMLLLAASDKGDKQVSTTGRFGMGFKSSYLLTDAPQVVSAKMAFEVTGGLYPRHLPPQDAEALRAQLRRHGDPVRGTAIRLVQSDPDQVDGALKDFHAWMPLTLLFSKAIGRIVLDDTLFAWTTRPVTDTAEYAQLRPGHPAIGRALTLHLTSGTVVLRMGEHGVEALANDVPTLWVVAPTQSLAEAGLAVNAPFTVDIGRSEVTSQAPENVELCDVLAAQLEIALIDLHAVTLAWTDFHRVMQFHPDVTYETFWTGMWSLLAERQLELPLNFAGTLVRRLFWQSGGARCLVSTREVVPSGLSGSYAVLTSLSQVSFVVTGVLTNPELLAAHVSVEDLPPGRLIHERIWQTLLVLGGTNLMPHVPRLALVDALLRIFGTSPVVHHHELPPAVPSPDDLDMDEKERITVTTYLNGFKFETASEEFVLGADLLIAGDSTEEETEEARRAAFAPEHRVLHRLSTPEVQRLLRACRGSMRAPAETLVAWATEAGSEEKRFAVLEYVLRGNLRLQVSEHIEFRMIPWISQLLKLELFARFSEDDRMTLAGNLGLGKLYRDMLTLHDSPPDEGKAYVRCEDPGGELERLYDWWSGAREQELWAFEGKRYPAFMRDGLGLKDPGTDREQWMGLFLIGSYMTLGFVEQGTRGFLEQAHGAGWMQTFCAETLDTDGWFRMLDTYVEQDDKQYRQWVDRFLATYQISRYLSDYIYLFQGANDATEPLTLRELLDVRKSHLYTGSGLDIPSVRSALGIGQHFVLRELVRRGVIQNRHFDAQCYVPTAKVRRFLDYLGCDIPTDVWFPDTSSRIHDFLVSHLGEEKARFHGDFDLPFVLFR